MIYCEKTTCAAFFIGVVFCSACTARLQRPVQKIIITTNINVNVISVEGQSSASLINRHRRPEKNSLALELKQPGKISKTYSVLRNNKPIAVALGIDSTEKTVYIKPHKYDDFS